MNGEGRPGREVRARPDGSGSDQWAQWILLALHAAVVVALVVAGYTFVKVLPALDLNPGAKILIAIGIPASLIVFVLRGAALWRRLRAHR